MIGLISCSAKKLGHAAPARDLYTSTLFRLSLAYAERYCDHVYVLSALHGLVPLNTLIEPYDHRLSPRRSDRNVWAAGVVSRLGDLHDPHADDEILLLAGTDYAAPLVAELRYGGWDSDVSQPLLGLQIGQRLRFLSRANQGAA